MMKELIQIQNELKAPKSRHNSFGNFNYRSCEDILEAVKPLLESYGCQLTLSDDIVNLGNRYYIKASAIFSKGDEAVTVTAMAREPETKKGMDDSQISGTASSYARKYALNGLFLIDDTKDADTDEYHNQVSKEKTPPKAPTEVNENGARYLTQLCIDTNTDPKKIMDAYKVKSFTEMSMEEYDKTCKVLESRKRTKDEERSAK